LFYFFQNWDKSAATSCRQVAAWVPVIFCSSCWVKSHKIAHNSQTAKTREKNKCRFEIIRILAILDKRFTKLKQKSNLNYPQIFSDSQSIYWVKQPH
jgi:hypothetical protein